MKLTYTLRGKPHTVGWLDGVIAIRPADAVRSAEGTTARMATRFGTGSATDDSQGGRFGVELPAKNRKLFEKSGWLFMDAREPLSKAAETRSRLVDADAVRPVFVTRGGMTMIGTDLVTVQTPANMTDAQSKAELQAAGLRFVRKLGFQPNLFEARLPAQVPLADALAKAQAHTGFVFAEPAFLEPIVGRLTPTDPDFPNQWQHANDGGNGGTKRADIHAEAAWDKTLGTGVKIAVIDNGMRVDHPDLKAGLFKGGYFESDGTGGATFVRIGTGTYPGGNHGTFCMGMAGARHNNGKGGCGSAPESLLIPVACLNDQVGTQTTLARAVAYAADPTTSDGKAKAADGADVIACSLGPNGADWALTSVLDLAIRGAAANGRGGRGVPIFWAVSNGPFDIALDEVSAHPETIAVGRSDRNDLADGSAFGPQLDFLAPGVDVYSTTQKGYGFGTGTSYACPLAAGVGALVIARNPAWTRDQVRDRMRQTCDQVGGVVYDKTGHNDDYGYGRVNAEAAVQ